MKISLFVLKCISATLRNTTRRRAKCVWQQCYKFLSTYDDRGAPITTNLQRTIQGNLYSHLLSLPPIQNSFFFLQKNASTKNVFALRNIYIRTYRTHTHTDTWQLFYLICCAFAKTNVQCIELKKKHLKKL